MLPLNQFCVIWNQSDSESKIGGQEPFFHQEHFLQNTQHQGEDFRCEIVALSRVHAVYIDEGQLVGCLDYYRSFRFKKGQRSFSCCTFSQEQKEYIYIYIYIYGLSIDKYFYRNNHCLHGEKLTLGNKCGFNFSFSFYIHAGTCISQITV